MGELIDENVGFHFVLPNLQMFPKIQLFTPYSHLFTPYSHLFTPYSLLLTPYSLLPSPISHLLHRISQKHRNKLSHKSLRIAIPGFLRGGDANFLEFGIEDGFG
jgi:hypothetical protein